MSSNRLLRNSKTPLPPGHPSGVLRVDVLQCTTFGHLRVCCWRAARNRLSLLTATYRAVTKGSGTTYAFFSILLGLVALALAFANAQDLNLPSPDGTMTLYEKAGNNARELWIEK